MTAEVVLSKAEHAKVLLHYFRGFDPSTTYRSLWPAKNGPPYQEFIRQYVGAVIEFHRPAGQERRSALDEDGTVAVDQLRKIRNLVFEAIKDCAENPMVEDGDKMFDRTKLIAQLVGAHAQTVNGISKLRRQQLEEAAALHSLLASNADKDGGELDE